MNETNQIPTDIRRRLERMSLQELKAMHAKTLEMLEKWQLKPASPTLSLDNTKDNLTTYKPKDFFDHQKENERIDALGDEKSIPEQFSDMLNQQNQRLEELKAQGQHEDFSIAEDKYLKLEEIYFEYDVELEGFDQHREELLETDFSSPREFEAAAKKLEGQIKTAEERKMQLEKQMESILMRERMINTEPYKDFEALGKKIEEFVKDEHGVTTPFKEYKDGEFHFGNKEDGKPEFKIVEGKDDYFEIHIENEDLEDGWETFTAFHKDELDLDPEPEREQIEETYELNIEFR